MRTTQLFDLSQSIAGERLAQYEYPWQILPDLGTLIQVMGAALPPDRFEQRGEGVWIARTATVHPSAVIIGPCIVDEEAHIRPGAFIRGKVLIGKRAVVGNSTEIKNSLLFNEVQVPHYNYVGDSVLGFRAHLGAGAVTSNVKGDRSPVVIHGDKEYATGFKKCGAMLGDRAEVGCNSVLNPGTVMGRDATVYPLSNVRGVVPEGYIYKNADTLVPRRND